MIGCGASARTCRLVSVVAAVVLNASLAFSQSSATLPRHALLGASVSDKDGVRATFIRPGSAADRGGLHVDDVIASVGGVPVHTSADFVSLIQATVTGQPIEFEIHRGSATLSLPITLDPATDERDPLVTTFYESVLVDGTLRRTLLTVPNGPEAPRPAVLIIGGIGCYSVDNAADPEDAYLRLAHDLGRQGFVVMRLEKSGVGDSKGPPCMTVDLLTEMHSYEMALRALKGDAHVDSRRVYLFGHSIGTVMAPRIALENAVAGVIVAEAVGRNWFEYELWNLRRQLELGGDSPSQVDATLAAKELCMHRLLIEKEPEAEIERTRPDCKLHNAYPVSAAYMQQAAALNIAEPWERFSVPLLAIYGTADFVTAEADHCRIVNIVNRYHPGIAELKLIEGMDHHLDRATTQQQAYDLRVKQHTSGPYDEGLSVVVADWLCRHERCVPPEPVRP